MGNEHLTRETYLMNEELPNIVHQAMEAHTSGESDVDRTQDLLTVIIAQLDELLQFKREMQEAMEGIQSSGMMGMIGKLLQRS